MNTCPEWCELATNPRHATEYHTTNAHGLQLRDHARTWSRHAHITVEIVATEIADADGNGAVTGPPAIGIYGLEDGHELTPPAAHRLAQALTDAAHHLEEDIIES